MGMEGGWLTKILSKILSIKDLDKYLEFDNYFDRVKRGKIESKFDDRGDDNVIRISIVIIMVIIGTIRIVGRVN